MLLIVVYTTKIDTKLRRVGNIVCSIIIQINA